MAEMLKKKYKMVIDEDDKENVFKMLEAMGYERQ